MAENPGPTGSEMASADSGQRARAHLSDECRIENCNRHAGLGIEQVEERHLGWKPETIVLDVIADDLDAGEPERRNIAPENIEMALESAVGRQVYTRLDDSLLAAL